MARVVKPHERKSLIAGQSRKGIRELDHKSGLVFSLRHFDPRQGQDFGDWEANQLLAQMLERLRDNCRKQNYSECFDDKFKVYGAIPAKSEFIHPPHVPPDADWASMHVQGLPCVIGHMFQNIFYIVFLDKEHKFWPTNIQQRGK